jgi:hypothetical protein
MNLDPASYWNNKANLFTLIVELYKFDTDYLDSYNLKNNLLAFESDYREYLISQLKVSESSPKNISAEQIKYFEYAREAVNELQAREYRGDMINSIINKCIKKMQRTRKSSN